MSKLELVNHPSTDFLDTLRKSYEFWNQVYQDSHLNIPLIWKKALQSNSENIKQIEKVWRQTNPQNFQINLVQFLDLWATVIRESNYENLKDFPIEYYTKISEEQLKAYSKILDLLQNYWRNIQEKNIE